MALGNAKSKSSKIRFTHSGDVDDKQKQMKLALELYASTGKLFKDKVNILSTKEWNTNDIQKFFISVYEKLEEPIVSQPTTDKEYANYLKATVTVAKWSAGFDAERKELTAPASAWMAVNAVTKELQHRVSIKGRKTGWEARAFSNILGPNQDDSLNVANFALTLV